MYVEYLVCQKLPVKIGTGSVVSGSSLYKVASKASLRKGQFCEDQKKGRNQTMQE